jgi:hypothetical protein
MDLVDYLRKEIRKSGYPLEIEISSMLDGKWEDVISTDSYYDSDEGKTRDIDINARRYYDFLDASLILLVNLTIECKKSENSAWVFFSRPFRYDISEIDGQYIDQIQALTNFDNTINMELILSSSRLHYSRIRKAARCFAEFHYQGKKTEISGKKEIFEAENQLKKYVSYVNEKTLKGNVSTDMNFIELQFPCIVFDGEMFEAQIKGNSLGLKKVQHLLLSTSQPSPYSEWDRSFLIDVVHKDYFKTFLREIEDSTKSLRLAVKKKASKISENIENIRQSLPSKRADEPTTRRR